MARVIRFLGMHFPYSGRPRDALRGALVGLVLLGAGGAATARSWGGAAYGVNPGDAVGMEFRDGAMQGWPLGALGGAAIGAALGAAAAVVAGAAWEERGSAAAVVVVGAVAGGLAAFAWGDVAARDRAVVVRAERHGTASPATGTFRVGNNDLRLAGDQHRPRNVPLLVFLVLAGTTVGALAGRGAMGSWPVGQFERPAGAAFEVKAKPVVPAPATRSPGA